MLTKSTKLDPRVKRTRQLLQRALTDLMHHKTFNSITVQDIAEQAEVNRATFYAHFEDKYALMNYNARETFYELVKHRLPENPSFTQDNIRLLILATAEFLKGAIGHCPPSPHEQENTAMVIQVQISLHDLLVEWLRSSNSSSKEMVASLTSWVIFGGVMRWVQNKQAVSIENLADQILETLMEGIKPHTQV